MQWSGVFNQFIFSGSYYTFIGSICCLFTLYLIRAISVRFYRRESNTGTKFSRLSRIGYYLAVEHEFAFTTVVLTLFFLSFISALLMNSTYYSFRIIHYHYLTLSIYVVPVLIFTGLFMCWFYLSKPFKARIKAARISMGGWLGFYHGLDDDMSL